MNFLQAFQASTVTGWSTFAFKRHFDADLTEADIVKNIIVSFDTLTMEEFQTEIIRAKAVNAKKRTLTEHIIAKCATHLVQVKKLRDSNGHSGHHDAHGQRSRSTCFRRPTGASVFASVDDVSEDWTGH